MQCEKFQRLKAEVDRLGLTLPDAYVELAESDDFVMRLRHNTIWLRLPGRAGPPAVQPGTQAVPDLQRGTGTRLLVSVAGSGRRSCRCFLGGPAWPARRLSERRRETLPPSKCFSAPRVSRSGSSTSLPSARTRMPATISGSRGIQACKAPNQSLQPTGAAVRLSRGAQPPPRPRRLSGLFGTLPPTLRGPSVADKSLSATEGPRRSAGAEERATGGACRLVSRRAVSGAAASRGPLGRPAGAGRKAAPAERDSVAAGAVMRQSGSRGFVRARSVPNHPLQQTGAAVRLSRGILPAPRPRLLSGVFGTLTPTRLWSSVADK